MLHDSHWGYADSTSTKTFLFADRKNLIWLQATAKSAPVYTNLWRKEKNKRKYKRKIRKINIGWTWESKTLYTLASHWSIALKKQKQSNTKGSVSAKVQK